MDNTSFILFEMVQNLFYSIIW